MAPMSSVDGTLLQTVVIGVVVVGVLVALACALAGRDVWSTIGRGGLWSQSQPPGGRSDPSEDQRDEEIRQMLGARRERRARRAQSDQAGPDPPIGAAPARRADAPGPAAAQDERPPSGRELAAEPIQADGELVEEIRQLAQARNARRRRQGLEPLDLDAEVARRLREL